MATAASYIRHWLTPRRWWSGAFGVLSRVLEEKHPFDREHGVDTGGLIYAEGLASGHEHDRHSAGYYATAPSLFRGAMSIWIETLAGSGYTVHDYSLVDIGCGKGRVLMLASEFAFREIAGVELNPRLARVAEKNLRKWMRRPRACRNIRVVVNDVLSAPLPDGPLAVFYFNSFEREMAEMWLARLGEIARARRHPLDLIYIHPEFDGLVRQVPGMQVLASADIPFSREDAEADAFEVAEDQCAIYRCARRA